MHECDFIGGQVFSDHIQLIVKASPEIALEELITTLKVGTSLWVRTNYPGLKDFEWQKSNFSLSISVEDIGSLLDKIKSAQPFLTAINNLNLSEDELKSFLE